MVIGNKNYAKLTSTILGLLMVTSSAYADEDQSTTRALLELTGITNQIYSLADLVSESSQTHSTRCSSKPASEFIMGFNAESVIFDLASAFEESHTTSIDPIDNWYQSALAKKIQAAEKETIDDALFTTFLQSEGYKNADRKNWISKIIDNLQTPRFVAIIGTEVEYAGIVHSGCIRSSETQGKLNSEQLMANIAREDKTLIAMLVRGEIVAETAYLYRKLTNEELERYEAFTSSEAGSLFYSNLIDAVQESFQLAGDRLTNSVKSEVHGSIDF